MKLGFSWSSTIVELISIILSPGFSTMAFNSSLFYSVGNTHDAFPEKLFFG